MTRLKVITEAILRDELRAREPETYTIPAGKILSPAAREYLQQRKIKIAREPAVMVRPAGQPGAAGGTSAGSAAPSGTAGSPGSRDAGAGGQTPKFIDHVTGAFYLEKPEHMTHLVGNQLVVKSHPRIVFRGKLDSLESLIVVIQSELSAKSENRRLVDDLSGILDLLRTMMRCDVLDEPLLQLDILGLTPAELRAQSHDPAQYFGVRPMVLPSYTMGRALVLINQLRSAVRETEVAAAEAFLVGSQMTRPDLILALNRLSSACHIMMCRQLAGYYS